jgi:hypothetical protein
MPSQGPWPSPHTPSLQPAADEPSQHCAGRRRSATLAATCLSWERAAISLARHSRQQHRGKPQQQPVWPLASCLVCGAKAEQITSTIYGMNVVCPTCGEYGITGSVLSMDQWHRLESQERNDALNKAKASARPGACPMITSNLLVADADQSTAVSN